MSKRRQPGDFVLVTYRRGADAYLCQIDGLGETDLGNNETSPCINHELSRVWGSPSLRCQDPECKEWPNLKVIKAFGTDRQHYNDKDYLYHVPECQMETPDESNSD